MKLFHLNPAMQLGGCLLASFVLTSQAQIIQNNQTDSSSPVTYDSFITPNLITTGQSSLASVTADISALNPTFTAAGLNDGIGLVNANANATYYYVVGSAPVMPNSATFQLTAGYDITNIQVISGWTDHNLGEQAFQVRLSIGGGAFTSIGIFTNNTSLNTGFSGPGSWMTTLTGANGVIATNVTGIEFIFMNPDTSNGTNAVGTSQAGDGSDGGTLIHEVQVFGTYYTNLPPVIVQTSQSTGSSSTAYDSFIAPNLITAGQSSLASATADTSALNGTFTAAGLDDGSAAGNVNKTYYEVTGSAPVMPNTATFQLTAGYNITNIQVISGWTDHNLGEQTFQVLLSIGGGAFTNFGTFTNNAAYGTGGSAQGSYLTTLTGGNGIIATNVTGIQFIFENPDTSNGNGSVGASQVGSSGGTLIHEVQVFGTFYTNLPGVTASYTNVSGSDSAFDSYIAPNLIQAGQSSLGSVSADTSALNPTFTAAGLNDGSAATSGNEAYYAVSSGEGTIMPNSAIFQLTAGYNITNIQVVSGWTSDNLGEHAFQVLVSIGTGPFTNIGTFVNNTAIDLGTSGSWMTTLRGTSGIIATNVTAVEFVFLNPDTSNGAGMVGNSQAGSNGGSVIHEVQVFGTYYTNLPTAINVTNIIQGNQTNGSSSSSFDSFITPNLITTGQSSLASEQADASALNGTFNASGLNDGSAAENGNLTYYSAGPGNGSVMPNTALFQLTAGYNITNIQVISGWGDHNLGEQAFQVFLSIDDGAFLNAGTFTNNASIATGFSGPGSWMTTLTGSNGVIAKDVTGIEFVFMNPDTSNGTGTVGTSQAGDGSTGGTVIHELQVFGTPYGVAPVVPSLNARLGKGSNLILTGTGGTPNAGYTLLTTTSLSAPVNWTTNSTGTLNGVGSLSNTIPVNTAIRASFFKLRMP